MKTKQQRILTALAIENRGEVITQNGLAMVVAPTCDHSSIANVYYRAVQMKLDALINMDGVVMIFWEN